MMNVISRPNKKQLKPTALGKETMDWLLSYCDFRDFANRSNVFVPGDSGNVFMLVIKGTLEIIAASEDGQELVLSKLNEGDFVGEMSVFIPASDRTVYLRATSESRIAMIDSAKLKELIKIFPDNGLESIYAVGSQISYRLMETTRKASSLALLDVSARIWRALQDQTLEPGSMTHPKGIQIKISRQELAKIAGCSREMAGRVIKQFCDEGKMSAQGKTMVIYYEECRTLIG